MSNVARLSNDGTFYAFEFDDNTKTNFNISAGSTAFSNQFDENTSTSISGNQKMSATSSGDLIVLDSINEVDTFDVIPTSNLELYLDTTSGFIRSQQSYTLASIFTSQTFTFTVPLGVTQVSAVVIGGGGGGAGNPSDPYNLGNTGGGGGGLAYGTFTVTPGENLTVTVGTAGAAGGTASSGSLAGTAGGATTIARGATVLLSGGGGLGGLDQQNSSSTGRAGGSSGGTERDGGGNGGSSGFATDNQSGSGGGGAGGYSGNGGDGGSNGGTGAAGSGGGGGGGDSGGANGGFGGRGGGVRELGEGTSGAASGGGGSGATAWYYGGGGGAAGDDTFFGGYTGGPGIVRIIWGSGRSYPSTSAPDQFSWGDISGNNRHSSITTGWSPYTIGGGGAQSGNTAWGIQTFGSTIQSGQYVIIPEIPYLSGSGTFTYELYNGYSNYSISTNGTVASGGVAIDPVVGPIEKSTFGTREFYRFGSFDGGIQRTTLKIPPQQVPYNAFLLTHTDVGNNVNPNLSSSINNERSSVLNVSFKSSDAYLGVCNGTNGYAYTGVTGTAARTIVLGVKFPASPATSYTAFSYGADGTGQRFNIRLQSTGQIRIQFGNSYVEIPTTAINDLNDFQLIAITTPDNGTVSDVRVWLNGNEKTSQLNVSNGSTSINTSSANNVTIGGSSHGTVEYLDNSAVTKVMIYSVVLSDLQIKQIYQSIIPVIYPFVERSL